MSTFGRYSASSADTKVVRALRPFVSGSMKAESNPAADGLMPTRTPDSGRPGPFAALLSLRTTTEYRTYPGAESAAAREAAGAASIASAPPPFVAPTSAPVPATRVIVQRSRPTLDAGIACVSCVQPAPV